MHLFVDGHAAIIGDFQTHSELCRSEKIRRLHQRLWAGGIEKGSLESNTALSCLFLRLPKILKLIKICLLNS